MIPLLGPVLVWAASLAARPEGLTDLPVPLPSSDAESFAPASEAFDARVSLVHEPGSEVEALLAALGREGFVVQPEDPAADAWRSATLQFGEWLCSNEWKVRWLPQDGKIANIEGEPGGACF